MKIKSQISGDFYKSLFNNIIDGLAYCRMIFDAKGRPIDFVYIEVNKNFEKLTGLKNVVGKKATELTPGIEISNPKLFEIYGRVSLIGKPERFEVYIEPLLRWFFISVYSPKKGFFVAMLQNITDLKKIEKDLEDARKAAQNVLEDLTAEKLKVEVARAKEEAILMSIGDGLFVTDERGDIVIINKMAEKLLGRKKTEIIGKSFLDAFAIEDEKGETILLEKNPINVALISAAPTITATTDPNYYYVRKDKTKFPVAVTVTPVFLNKKIIGTIEIFRDVTREKEIDKAKSEFVSLASHQLRTPTTAISWYSEMLLGEEVGVLGEKQKKFLKEIHHGNQRMIELVNALLSVSRIELDTFSIEPGPVDIAVIADDVLGELKSQINDKGIKIERKYENNIPIIESDQRLIRIIVQNLLSNAVAYTFEKGKISVGVKKTGKDVLIEVKDNGCGIPQNVQSNIYTKFFRADNARSIKSDGTGLGLYIAKSIVEALGGGIDFHSKEGEGTVFFVNIPSRGMAKKGLVRGLV